jgi:hypothetical protein
MRASSVTTYGPGGGGETDPGIRQQGIESKFKEKPSCLLPGFMYRSGPMAVGGRVFDFRGYFATVE